MKKLFFIACCAAMLVTGCKDGKNSSDLANMQQSDSLNNIIAQKDSEINDLMGTFNEVQEGLRQISDAENRVALAKAGEGVNSKQKIKEDIRFIANGHFFRGAGRLVKHFFTRPTLSKQQKMEA